MAEIENPHDMFFKRSMSDINIASDFALNYFPEEIKEKIDLKGMALFKNDAVSKFLKENQSDILYKIKLVVLKVLKLKGMKSNFPN